MLEGLLWAIWKFYHYHFTISPFLVCLQFSSSSNLAFLKRNCWLLQTFQASSLCHLFLDCYLIGMSVRCLNLSLKKLGVIKCSRCCWECSTKWLFIHLWILLTRSLRWIFLMLITDETERIYEHQFQPLMRVFINSLCRAGPVIMDSSTLLQRRYSCTLRGVYSSIWVDF